MAVIGAGQAGLAVSHELSRAKVDHVVLERSRIGQAWRGRWDTFSLVTPNWTMDLPGLAYAGSDPDGHVVRDEIVDYLEEYAAAFGAPVREGIDITGLERGGQGEFVLRSPAGDLTTAQVVVATGAYQRPHRPPVEGAFATDLLVIDADSYSRPDALPPGRVLLIGSGQTGCQLAEDLHLAGREVFLSCGKAPWGPRRAGGHDIVTLLAMTDWFEHSLADLPSPAARLAGNILLTGRGGGHDLHLRTLQAMGVTLLGRLAGVDGKRATFAPDLGATVAFGDARYQDMCRLLAEKVTAARSIPLPELVEPPPFEAPAITDLVLDGFGTVIFTSGFRPDYTRWIQLPGFDEMGFPVTADCASTAVPGLYFAGVHFLRKRKSSLLFGVGEDAAIVAGSIAAGA